MANEFRVVNVDTNDYLLKLYGDAPLSTEISLRAALYTDDGGETGGIYLPDGHGLTWNRESRFADIPTSNVMAAVAREGVIEVQPRANAPSPTNLVQNRLWPTRQQRDRRRPSVRSLRKGQTRDCLAAPL